MTDIQAWLDHGKTLADKTIPGPWVSEWVEDDDWHEIHGQPFDGMVCPQVATIQGGGENDAAFIADARTRLPQALNAIQAVLKIHKPRTTYPLAGEWDLAGKYIPYCKHGDDEDHPDHKMIDGWFQCTTVPELVCSEETEGDPWPWPCPTVEAIQTAIEEQPC